MRLNGVRFIAAFSIAVAFTMAGPPGHADARSAMDYCKATQGFNAGLIYHATLNFGGGPAYFDGTPTLHPGDVYRVMAQAGTVNDGGWPSSTNWTPDGAGWTHVAPAGGSWPAPGLPKYGLIAAWAGLSGYYWLGTNSLCIQWTGSTSDYAWFWMNDENVSDNKGYWELSVDVFPAD